MKYVLYHSNCYDGFGAAFAAWKKWGDEDTKYLPVSYGNPPPLMPGAKNIVILDFSYPKGVLLELAKVADVVVLDHHKTAQEALGDLAHGMKSTVNPHVVFDMNRSGALLAWNYFHPGEAAPKFIEHLSDRDLWTFKLPGTAKIHKALVSYPMDFKLWDTFLTHSGVQKLLYEGETCERMYNELVSKICDAAFTQTIDGHKVPVVNTSIAWSEVGQELLERNPTTPFAASFTVFGDQIMWSLRSRPEFDVSEIAKKFGGGGHKNAAGFKAVRP